MRGPGREGDGVRGGDLLVLAVGAEGDGREQGEGGRDGQDGPRGGASPDPRGPCLGRRHPIADPPNPQMLNAERNSPRWTKVTGNKMIGGGDGERNGGKK